MLRNIAFACVAALAMAGCGGTGADDTTTVTTQDLSMPLFKVVSGSYTVSNVTKVQDDCMLALEAAGAFPSIQVTNDGNGHLSLGSQCMTTGNPPTCNPAVYSNGTGMFTDSYHVTTTATTTVTADSGGTCTYDRTRTNTVTVTDNNKLSVSFQEDESNISAGCGGGPATCTSKYTFNAAM
jgi:hypothetical protein